MTTAVPDHLRRFPCMEPWVGSRYRDQRHRRLLVVGESHYLPKESTIHRYPGPWYQSQQDDLSPKEVEWVSTAGNITGKWRRAHRIYGEIQKEIVCTLIENGVTPDEFPLNHVAYCNYFLRPAKEGGSMKGNAVQQDFEVAAEVLGWFIARHGPELVIVTSRFAGGHDGRRADRGPYAEDVLKEHDIPCDSTPHPGSPAWNKVCDRYGNVRGRDLFCNFLRKWRWATGANSTSR